MCVEFCPVPRLSRLPGPAQTVNSLNCRLFCVVFLQRTAVETIYGNRTATGGWSQVPLGASQPMVTIRHRFGSHASKGQDDSSTARLLDRPRQTSTRGLKDWDLALYLELSRVRAPLLQRYCTLALQRFKVKVDGPPQVNYIYTLHNFMVAG